MALIAVVAASAGTGWALSHTASGTYARPVLARRPVRRIVRPARLPAGWSYLAVARGHRLTVYSQPSSQHRVARLNNPTVTRMPLTLLVKAVHGRWIETYLPLRPDGSLGWVPHQAIRLTTTPWSVTVHLRQHRLVVARGRRDVRAWPVAVGKPATPTPTGTFFITELLKQPDPLGAYGPYAYGTSAYSAVLRQFGTGGDGQVGLHGTDEPWVIGTSVTHGCIRLRNPNLLWLSKRLPLGTPVRIKPS